MGFDEPDPDYCFFGDEGMEGDDQDEQEISPDDYEPNTPTAEEEAELVEIFSAWGALPGEIQTVGRAEIFAVVRLLETTSGQVVIWTDYQALVLGFQRGRRYTLGCSKMADLWARFWEALQERPGGESCVKIRKIKAHQSLMAVREAKASCNLSQWLGNRRADNLAKQGADELELPDEVVDRVTLHTRMASLFLRRMLVVMQHVLEQAPAAASRPKKVVERPRWQARQARLSAALLASQHTLVKRTLSSGRDMWFCSRCYACRPVGPGLQCWLRHRPCTPAAPGMEVAACPRAHFSHYLVFWGEVCICRECGCYSGPGSRIQDLRGPCPGRPAPRARCNWQLVERGRHPGTGKRMKKLKQAEVLKFGFSAVGHSLWQVHDDSG